MHTSKRQDSSINNTVYIAHVNVHVIDRAQLASLARALPDMPKLDTQYTVTRDVSVRKLAKHDRNGAHDSFASTIRTCRRCY